jgi:SAM-dependent methyltransferase
MKPAFSDSFLFWDKLAKLNKNLPHVDKILGHYKSESFLMILKRWGVDLDGTTILKTDLREEAFGRDEILFSLSSNNTHSFGIDISPIAVLEADKNCRLRGFKCNYSCADVRALPFGDESFDLILSASTLDHFSNKREITGALAELSRVTKNGGKIIITINNGHNMFFWFLLKAGRLFGVIPYPVQFYTLKALDAACSQAGMDIVRKNFIVHILGPVNTMFLIARKIFRSSRVDSWASRYVWLMRRLERLSFIRPFTGWFIAIECVKAAGNKGDKIF